MRCYLDDTVGPPAHSSTAGAHESWVENAAGLNSAGGGAIVGPIAAVTAVTGTAFATITARFASLPFSSSNT